MSSNQPFFKKRLMNVRLGRFHFGPGWVATITTLLLLALLVNLGLWQKRRGDEKSAMITRYEERSRSQALSIDDLIALDKDSMDFPVSLRGVYNHEQSFLLDNRTHNGIPGFQLITPMDAGNYYFLVNRGWVPQGRTRQDTPKYPKPEGEITITGITHVPNPDYFVLQEDSYQDVTWPYIIQKIDLEKARQHFKKPLAPFTVRLNPQEGSGFIREWRSNPMTPEKHYGYSFQWFSLALALLIIYITVNTRRIEPEQHKTTNEPPSKH